MESYTSGAAGTPVTRCTAATATLRGATMDDRTPKVQDRKRDSEISKIVDQLTARGAC